MSTENTRLKSDEPSIELKRQELRLPDHLRKELKKPLGLLLKGEEIDQWLSNMPSVTAVGDISAITAFEAGIVPKISIVDFKTKREESQDLSERVKRIGREVIRIKNPPATISKELWNAVERGYKSDADVRIEIDGEEDLAALVCIYLAPEKHIVIYGMPDEGIIAVTVNMESRKMVANILKRMEAVNGDRSGKQEGEPTT